MALSISFNLAALAFWSVDVMVNRLITVFQHSHTPTLQHYLNNVH